MKNEHNAPSVISTLFHPLTHGALDHLAAGSRVAFLGAQYHPALSSIDAAKITFQQNFKPYVDILQQHGHTSMPELPEGLNEHYDVVFISMPKNKLEAHYILARGVQILKTGGYIFCAADNKSGGNRLQKMLHKTGLDDIQTISKNKARTAWGVKENIDKNIIISMIKEGSTQGILGNKYTSMPGVFGWNKADKGSEILLHFLPKSLKGHCADFGCGYGYLSRNILQKLSNIEALTCIDADHRAVKLCEENLKDFTAQTPLNFMWEDLTKPLEKDNSFDSIVMNPPFHEGKKTDNEIGKAFISSAYKALKHDGALWMVANAHLPYEPVLQNVFSKVEKKFEGQGFKVFCAVK